MTTRDKDMIALGMFIGFAAGIVATILWQLSL